jgi:hypothetical protein
MDALLRTHEDAVEHLESLAPTARQHRRRLDRETLLERLSMALGDAE